MGGNKDRWGNKERWCGWGGGWGGIRTGGGNRDINKVQNEVF